MVGYFLPREYENTYAVIGKLPESRYDGCMNWAIDAYALLSEKFKGDHGTLLVIKVHDAHVPQLL